MGFLDAIHAGKFGINVEFTPHNAAEVKHVAEIGKGLVELNKKYAEHDIVFGSVSLTQNPGGNLSFDHQASLSILKEEGFPEEIEISPHVTGKDMNVDGVRSLLLSLSERGVGHVLALTGDLSDLSKGVFEVDSLGLLQLINEINLDILKGCKTAEDFAAAPIIEGGAAVSPYKYTDGSLAMQYIKARKKVREGAAFLTLQSGWDADRAKHLIDEIGTIGVPIIGNVLVVTFPVARYMKTLPGCVVADEFLEVLKGKKLIPALERAGQQFAMFRQLGYHGVDLGKPGEFKKLEHIERVIDTALEIENWQEFKENISFPVPENPTPPVKPGAGFSKMIHGLLLEEDKGLYNAAKAVLGPVNNSAEKEGLLYRLFYSLESMGKNLMYHCEHCGDCFLPENDYICTMGECEKGLDNPPCGDADRRGYCGNNEERVCVGESLYYRLKNYGDLESHTEKTLPRRKPALADTASLLNYYYGRDHAFSENPLEGSGLIQIAELLHASIPLPGAAMQFVQKMGKEGFTRHNRGLAMVEHIISSQAQQGADYIDINLDALGDDDPATLMRRFVRLVHRHGGGTPPCIDSSDVKVLQAGLEEWFSLGDDLATPLVNSLPHNERENFGDLLAMRKQRKFSLVCLLVGPTGPFTTADDLVGGAKELFETTQQAGFAPEDILFDCVTLGISSDGCMDAMGEIKASHTHHSFAAIERIRKEMPGVHAILGVSNWVHGVKKRRLGHIRAFIAAAQKRGLDGAIVDVEKQFGVKPVAAELIEFVEMFVALDGSEDSMMTYSAAMMNARESGWL